MHRFYIEKADFSQPQVMVSDRHEIHHMTAVLRLKAGDKVLIFNGRHEEALCKITKIKEAAMSVAVESVVQARPKSQILILACAVPKKAKFEFIIEKATELGVDAIVPLQTKRSDVIFTKDKAAHKQQRFEKVAVNAAKQCKRMDVPKIYPITDFKDCFKVFPADSQLMIAALNSQTLPIKEALNKVSLQKPLVIFIGPEGDFTADEVAFALSQKATAVSLGSTVLKVDTAAMTSVAFCRFLLYN